MKRVLLDENLDRRLKNYFSAELDVTSVPDQGWQSKKNGDLLSAMGAEGIVYLVTADRNLRFQQNLDKYSVVIIVVCAYDNRLKGLIPFISKIEAGILAAELTDKIIEIDLRLP
jgi:hypothetical protein